MQADKSKIEYGEIIPGFNLVKTISKEHGETKVRVSITENEFTIFTFERHPISRTKFIKEAKKDEHGTFCYTQWYWDASHATRQFLFMPILGHRIYLAARKAGWDWKKEQKNKFKEGVDLGIWLYDKAGEIIENKP